MGCFSFPAHRLTDARGVHSFMGLIARDMVQRGENGKNKFDELFGVKPFEFK
jgi:hypothetical protein